MDFIHYEINEMAGPFKYVTSRFPIDDFSFTLTKEQLINNVEEELNSFRDISWSSYSIRDIINGFSSIDGLEGYILNVVERIEGDKPHTIRYIGLPESSGNIPDLVVIAKVSSSGTCYLFSNNKKALEFLIA